MYRHILVPLENSPIDTIVLKHVCKLAKYCGSKLTLIHVSSGYVARNLEQLHLAPSREMREDAHYLSKLCKRLEKRGFKVAIHLAYGEPSNEILNFVRRCRCDLIAMATHGHRMLANLILGSVSREIQHHTDIPVLLIRSSQRSKKGEPSEKEQTTQRLKQAKPKLRQQKKRKKRNTQA